MQLALKGEACQITQSNHLFLSCFPFVAPAAPRTLLTFACDRERDWLLHCTKGRCLRVLNFGFHIYIPMSS